MAVESDSPAAIPSRRPARADLGPVTRKYVASMGWWSVNFHTHISLVNKYVYVEVPKAGCGTMKATLGALEGARMNPMHAQRFRDTPHNGMRSGAHVRPYQLPVDMLEEVFTSPNYQRFTVVRDPASRALSGYLEKIRQDLPQAGPIADVLEQRTGVRPAGADISLEDFLSVIGEMDSRDQDAHWRRQTDHIGYGIIDYTDIIHLEDLDRSWPRIAELTSTPDLSESFYCKFSTGAATKKDEYFTPETRAKVREIYARDYELLSY